MTYRSVTEIKVWKTRWSDLPNDVTRCFTSSEQKAYVEGALYFKEIAHRSGEPALIEIVAELSNDQPMRVYVERVGSNSPDVWFGFTYRHRDRQPQFKLAEREFDTPGIPKRLKSLFSVYSGIREGEQDRGGLRTPRLMDERELEPFEDSLLEPHSERYLEFFSFANGDIVAYRKDGAAILFDHETREVFRKDMNEFLDDYFSELSKTYAAALMEHVNRSNTRE